MTGEPELHYKSHKRWLTQCLVSFPVTVFMLAVAFATMSMSLNLQGYVVRNKTPFWAPFFLSEKRSFVQTRCGSTSERKVVTKKAFPPQERDSPIYVQALSHHDEPGGIFDKNNTVLALFPVCLSSAAIMVRKNASFEPVLFYVTNDQFAKTGSGQT